MKNLMKFLVLSILIINTLGACQSCKKEPIKPDPKPTVYCTVTLLPADGVTIIPSLPNGSTKVVLGGSISFDFNSGSNIKYKILSEGVSITTDYIVGSYHYSNPNVLVNLHLQVVTEVVTNPVTVSATVGGTVNPIGVINVEYGKDLILVPVEEPGYTLTSIKVKGISVPVIKPYTLTNVTSITDVKFEFTLTDFLTLTNGADNKTRPWFLKSLEYYDVNGNLLHTSDLTGDSRLTNKCYFYSNGNLESFTQQGVLVANGNWTLVGKTFTQAGVCTVISLTDKIFSYQRPITQNDGTVEYYRQTYWRP